MHKLLQKQLEKSKLSPQELYKKQECELLLDNVTHAYEDYDTKTNLLQNALDMTTQEMQMLYDRLERASKERSRAIINSISDLVMIMNRDGIYLEVFDEGKEHLLVKPKAKVIGRSVYEIFDKEEADVFNSLLADAFETKEMQLLHYDLMLGEKKHYFEARVSTFYSHVDGVDLALVLIRDVTDEHDSQQNSKLFEKIFAEATEGILIEDENRNVIFINPSMQDLIHMSAHECIGKHSSYFSDTMLGEKLSAEVAQEMQSVGFWHGEVEIKRFDGSKLLSWLSIDSITNDDGSLRNVVIMLTDLSEVKQSRRQLEFLSTHDTLTGIANRALIFDRAEHALQTLLRAGKKGALIFIDIDHFKEINDLYGHPAGDQLLKDMVHRLKDILRARDTLGRLSGDEFVIIIDDMNTNDEISAIIQKIQKGFLLPFMIKNREVKITLSMGISIMPDDGKSANELINAADFALYQVKNSGRNNFKFFSQNSSSSSHEYFEILREIREALSQGGFRIHYQPQYGIVDGKLKGAEALLRSSNKGLEKIPISRIIEIAEESGLVSEIGRFVIRTVFEQVAIWKREGIFQKKIAVNLSRAEIGMDNLVTLISDCLESMEVEAEDIEFEITESTLLYNSAKAKENLDALRAMGCKFSIDDFGTGYSSLSTLKKFNFDKLKIDRSFIEDLDTNEDDQVIVSAIISMSKELGLTVLAEGVENIRQLNFLQMYQCDEVQGFYYHEALSVQEMAEVFKRER